MSSIINKVLFDPILNFNQHQLERINKICSPLTDCFGLNYFAYGRVFNNGRYILISNCNELVDKVACHDFHFRSDYFNKQPQFLCKQETQHFIWPETSDDEFLKIMNNKNVHNGINFLQQNNGTLEYYFFGMDKSSLLMREFYNKHAAVLEDFAAYFKKVGADLINPFDMTRQGTSPHLQKTYPMIESIFMQSTPWERKINHFHTLLQENVQKEILEIGKRYSLTRRELECLSYLSVGKSTKCIAQTLNIGVRTVETYMENLRKKTKCQNKNELIQWFEETYRGFLNKTPFIP